MRRRELIMIAGYGLGLAGCEPDRSTLSTALPILKADLVQVAVDLRRSQHTQSADWASEAPISTYCGGKPENCSRTHVRDIRSAPAIEALLEFVNMRLSGWSVPSFGLPIGDVEINFFEDGKRTGTFGSGVQFFSRGGFPEVKFRDASLIEIQQFRELAHIQ
jgi:hypothetical protein